MFTRGALGLHNSGNGGFIMGKPGNVGADGAFIFDVQDNGGAAAPSAALSPASRPPTDDQPRSCATAPASQVRATTRSSPSTIRANRISPISLAPCRRRASKGVAAVSRATKSASRPT